MKRVQARSAKMPMLEIIISIGIFAVVSVFILELFLAANTLQNRARDKSKAIVLAETIAESVKSAKSFEDAAQELDLVKTAGSLSKKKNGYYQVSKIDEAKGSESIELYTRHYDENWEKADGEDTYSVIVIPYEETVQGKIMSNYEIYVYRLKGYVSVMSEKDSEELYRLSFSHVFPQK